MFVSNDVYQRSVMLELSRRENYLHKRVSSQIISKSFSMFIQNQGALVLSHSYIVDFLSIFHFILNLYENFHMTWSIFKLNHIVLGRVQILVVYNVLIVLICE